MLTRFQRSNQNTNLDQHPLVNVGEKVDEGQVIADGPASQNGRLALGQNVLIAVMPFDGYNFEDAIVISENLVRHDAYTSVHIEKFEKEARETKLGPEKITRDIPGLSEAALRDLDEDGVVRIGADVKHNSILVGHTSFKGETDPDPRRAAAPLDLRREGARSERHFSCGFRPVTAVSCSAPCASGAATRASSSSRASRRWCASTSRRSAA